MEYCAFVDKHGRHPTKDDGRLYTWKEIQKKSHQNGKLSDMQIQKLVSVGFVWRGVKERSWISKYNQLMQHMSDNNGILPESKSTLGK